MNPNRLAIENRQKWIWAERVGVPSTRDFWFNAKSPSDSNYRRKTGSDGNYVARRTVPSGPDFGVRMHIGVLTFKISLPGCGSLKEKRQRMGGLHERFGRNPAIAVCESGDLDRWDASEWSFVVAATSRQKVESLSSEIEEKLQRTVDGRVLDVTRELV